MSHWWSHSCRWESCDVSLACPDTTHGCFTDDRQYPGLQAVLVLKK